MPQRKTKSFYGVKISNTTLYHGDILLNMFNTNTRSMIIRLLYITVKQFQWQDSNGFSWIICAL